MDPILHLSLPVRDLEATRSFYVDLLVCPPGRPVAAGIDVWFYGLQLTLQLQPDHVLPDADQGARHFGVTLERAALVELVARLEGSDVSWVRPLTHDTLGTLRGKTSATIADPSGNLIELKSYDDPHVALGRS